MGDNGLCVNVESSLLATVTMFHLPNSLSRDLVPSLWDYSSTESELRSQLRKIRLSSQPIYSGENIFGRIFQGGYSLEDIPGRISPEGYSQSLRKIPELSAKNSCVQCTRARNFSHVRACEEYSTTMQAFP